MVREHSGNLTPYAIAAIAILATACGPKPTDAYLGQWVGGFEIMEGARPGPEGSLKGFLQLYARQRYRLHLENKLQSWDVTGDWQVEARRIVLHLGKIEYVTPSEIDQAAFGYHAIAQADIAALYGPKTYFRIEDGGRWLTGLQSKLGAYVGRQRFERKERPIP